MCRQGHLYFFWSQAVVVPAINCQVVGLHTMLAVFSGFCVIKVYSLRLFISTDPQISWHGTRRGASSRNLKNVSFSFDGAGSHSTWFTKNCVRIHCVLSGLRGGDLQREDATYCLSRCPGCQYLFAQRCGKPDICTQSLLILLQGGNSPHHLRFCCG